MRYFYPYLFTVLILCLFTVVPACSGGTSIIPDPAASRVETQNTTAPVVLWGIWDIHLDAETKTIEAVPLRGPAFACNVVGFVDGPPANLLLENLVVDIQTDYTDISLDVGLKHPFPGLDQYTGFDVLGVFMGDGTSVYIGPDGFPMAGEDDQQLLNPDGYTRWFNASEFTGAGETMPLLGYTPGKLGSPGYTPSAELNPYKYFTDDLDKEIDAFEFLYNHPDDRGCFRPGSVNYRVYDLRFPTPSPGITFQYAVIAHWEPPENQGTSLDDFPISANAAEAVVVDLYDSFSTIYYVDETTFGGNVILDISVYDWTATCTGEMEEYAIKCYSDAWTGDGAVDMTPIDSGINYYTYRTDIPVTTLTSDDPLPVWVEISYPELDYSNDFSIENDADGVLAGYFQIDIAVDNVNPETGWAHTWGEPLVDEGYGVAIDNNNNAYVTGRINVSEESEVFLAKYDISGGLIWIKRWAGTVYHDYGRGVAVHDSGYVYVGGFFTGSNVNFNPDGTDLHSCAGIGSDSFLTKFDLDGVYQWTVTWGGTSSDFCYGVAVDNPGNIWLTGSFVNTCDFDPGTGTDSHDSNGSFDAYVSKLDSDGGFIWAGTWGGDNWDEGSGIAVDNSGNAFVVGQFRESSVDIDFNTNVGENDYHDSNGAEDIFLSKFDSDENYEWALTWGGTDGDKGKGVAVDNLGHVYVTGCFSGTCDFDPDPGVGETEFHIVVGGYDAFLSKFSSDNGNYEWGKHWGGNLDDYGKGVAVNGIDYVYVTGWFLSPNVGFDPGGGDVHSSNGGRDVFLSRFDSGGDFEWARTWGETNYDVGRSVAACSSGSVYVAGWVNGDVEMAPVDAPCSEDSDIHTSFGGYDAFLAKYLQDGCW